MNARRARRTAGGRQKDGPVAACPACGTDSIEGAAFCHACGAPLGDGRARSGPSATGLSRRALAGLGVIALVIAGGVFVLATQTGQRQPAIPGPGPMTPSLPQLASPLGEGAIAGRPGGAPPDLSRMTPRDAADRLFNRIMRESEQGRREEAIRFVPMAVQAYANLQNLDRDAHYHLGLIHEVAGDRESGERHIAALRDGAPDHLLALMLEHAIARKAGDEATVQLTIKRFRDAYAAELALGRPEYQAHRNNIDQFRAGPAK